jgi:hypothetical protein
MSNEQTRPYQLESLWRVLRDVRFPGAAGVPAKTAALVLQHLDCLQQPLADLSSGTLQGSWEGALELITRTTDALRQVWTVLQLRNALIIRLAWPVALIQ